MRQGSTTQGGDTISHRFSLDDALVGHWNSAPFDYGSMESSELGFLPDGRGWSALHNVAGTSVTRFSWQCWEPGVLTLRTSWMVYFETNRAGALVSTESPRQLDEVERYDYVIAPSTPAPGADPIDAVTFARPLEFAFHYARGPRDILPEHDPAHPAHPYLPHQSH